MCDPLAVERVIGSLLSYALKFGTGKPVSPAGCTPSRWPATVRKARPHRSGTFQMRRLKALVVLRQESGILAILRMGALQQGHLGRVLARATMRRLRIVLIELGMCRSVGSAAPLDR